MATLTGVLLDVSGSMASSIGDGIDEEGGTWAQSIFTVIDNLVEHDVSENNHVFSICFGGRNEDSEIFDTIGTIQDIRDIESSDDNPASLSTIEDIFRILETNGAKNIRKWAQKEMVSTIVPDLKAQLILRKLKSDKQFTRRLVHECLPSVCRNVYDPISIVPVFGIFQSFATSAVTSLKQASIQDVEGVVDKVLALIEDDFKMKEISNESVFSVRQAASIIRGFTGKGNLSKRRARELLTAVEPYIYGGTPLFSALEEAITLFTESQSSYRYHDRLLFVLSDGMPTECGDLNIIKLKLKKANVQVVGCYISRSSEVEPRTLHSVEGPYWEEGASNLFNLSSTIATQLVTRAIFIKQGWNIDLTNNETKLFMHINHPYHLREACSLARNIVCSQDALTGLLASVSLDIYINQKNTGFGAKHQEESTCYANSAATVLHLAMHRISGRTGGYPSFEKIRGDLIDRFGYEGADIFQVLKEVCPKYRLHYQEVNFANAMKAIAEKRPVIALFGLSKKEWKQFGSFYKENTTGILRTNDLDVRRRGSNVSTKDGGHAVVLTSYDSKGLRLMNSWGEDWADNGFFRVENADILDLQFIDVYWTINDLYPEEQEYYRVHGSESAKKLMRSLKCLKFAEFECPICKETSKVTSFEGSWSSVTCPECYFDFPCMDGQGNILALNMYLTSLSR